MTDHIVNVVKPIRIKVVKVGNGHRSQVFDGTTPKRITWKKTYDQALEAAITWIEDNYEVVEDED